MKCIQKEINKKSFNTSVIVNVKVTDDLVISGSKCYTHTTNVLAPPIILKSLVHRPLT